MNEANIVDRARAILVAAVTDAEQRDDGTYFAGLADKIGNADAAQIDTWLALDAIILALKASDSAHNKAGGLWYRRWHKLATQAPDQPKEGET